MTHKIQEDLSSLVKESARFQESLDLALILYPNDIKQIIFELFLKDFLSQKFKQLKRFLRMIWFWQLDMLVLRLMKSL